MSAPYRIGIVVSRFNEVVTRRLLDGALEELEGAGLARQDVPVAWVPGALEIPVTAQEMARRRSLEAVVALGCVLRGETVHFDLVAAESARGLREASQATGVPMLNGILAADDLLAALERAGGKQGNRGRDAARAALEMARLFRSLGGEQAAGE
jgi:6,7-dimethyl-8-ribityllumazine synthase